MLSGGSSTAGEKHMVIPEAMTLVDLLIQALRATEYLLILYAVAKSSLWILKSLKRIGGGLGRASVHGRMGIDDEIVEVAANGNIGALLTLMVAHVAGMYALAHILGSTVISR
jgi:hypothetical protein